MTWNREVARSGGSSEAGGGGFRAAGERIVIVGHSNHRCTMLKYLLSILV